MKTTYFCTIHNWKGTESCPTCNLKPAPWPGKPPALKQQVGGNHYKDLAIQPVEYCQKNKLGFCESSAIKYISRWRSKGGLQDIDKAIHFLNMLKEIEETS